MYFSFSFRRGTKDIKKSTMIKMDWLKMTINHLQFIYDKNIFGDISDDVPQNL